MSEYSTLPSGERFSVPRSFNTKTMVNQVSVQEHTTATDTCVNMGLGHCGYFRVCACLLYNIICHILAAEISSNHFG